MVLALFVLVGCQLAGEALRLFFRLPIPGPVIGMMLLTVGLAVRDRLRPAQADARTSLDRVAGYLLKHMGLLFVPAGVGVIAEADAVRQHWLAVVVGVLGSTVLSLLATGLVMHRFVGRRPIEREAGS